MYTILQKVQAFNYLKMPESEETIADDLDMDIVIPLIDARNYYFSEVLKIARKQRKIGYWI